MDKINKYLNYFIILIAIIFFIIIGYYVFFNMTVNGEIVGNDITTNEEYNIGYSLFRNYNSLVNNEDISKIEKVYYNNVSRELITKLKEKVANFEDDIRIKNIQKKGSDIYIVEYYYGNSLDFNKEKEYYKVIFKIKDGSYVVLHDSMYESI